MARSDPAIVWLVQVNLPYHFTGYNKQNPGHNEQK